MLLDILSRKYKPFKLSVIMLNNVMLSVMVLLKYLDVWLTHLL